MWWSISLQAQNVKRNWYIGWINKSMISAPWRANTRCECSSSSRTAVDAQTFWIFRVSEHVSPHGSILRQPACSLCPSVVDGAPWLSNASPRYVTHLGRQSYCLCATSALAACPIACVLGVRASLLHPTSKQQSRAERRLAPPEHHHQRYDPLCFTDKRASFPAGSTANIQVSGLYMYPFEWIITLNQPAVI